MTGVTVSGEACTENHFSGKTYFYTIHPCAAATDGEWHLGSVGDVVAIMDLRWPRVEGRREEEVRLSSFCKAEEKRGR